MKISKFFSFFAIFLSNLNFCYEIISKNILIEIETEANQAKVIETIQYKFNKTTLLKIEKIIPPVSGNITNISVSSSSLNIDKYVIEDDDDTNSKIIRIYINKLKENDKVNIEFIYLIKGVLNGNKTTIELSNKDSGKDIEAKVEVIIKKLYETLTPEKVVTNNPGDAFKRVEIQSETNSSFYTFVVPASRKNFMKNQRNTTNNDFKVSFNVLLLKNETKDINFELTKENLLVASEDSFKLSYERPQVKLRDYNLSSSYSANQYFETLVAIIIIGLIVVIIFNVTKK